MRSVRSGSLTFLAVAVLVGTGLSSGKAQERTDRRSGPRDWSHSQIVASGWGADDPGVRRDRRTLRKHMQRDDARSRRMPVAQWMAWVMKNARRQAGATSTSTNDVKLDWSLNTGGTGSVIGYPAKFSFDVSASNCSDVIYFTVNQNGSATAPNVIAITNPYVGCPGNPLNLTPTVKFALRLQYGTGTSPTLSLDGTVLYLFESRSSGNGGPILHAINVNNITTNPGAYNFNTGAWTSVHTLAAPTGLANSEQRFQLTFGSNTNALSSPYTTTTATGSISATTMAASTGSTTRTPPRRPNRAAGRSPARRPPSSRPCTMRISWWPATPTGISTGLTRRPVRRPASRRSVSAAARRRRAVPVG